MPASCPPNPSPRPDGSHASPDTPVLAREKLAKRAREQAAANRAELVRARKGRRFSRLRLVFWGLELVVLLACVEFAVRRHFRRDRPGQDAARVHEQGMSPAPVLSDAVALAGAKATPGTLLAATDKLAEGSEAMRNAQAQYALDRKLPIEIENSIGMRFRLVLAGSCVIGSPEGERGRGVVEPQHVRVVYRPFYLGKFEVTQAEFTKIMARNPSGFRGPRRPVEEITWYEAQKFCINLNEREGLPKNTYRLPTEVEWEYACRAGTTTAYYSGNDLADGNRVAETADNNDRGTANVGGRPPNALGLYNMHGNVWEWCLDRYTRYPEDPTPITDDEKRMRCLRGGNWRVRVVDCRSAERGRLTPTSHGNILGFRVLRTIPELGEEDTSEVLPLDSIR